MLKKRGGVYVSGAKYGKTKKNDPLRSPGGCRGKLVRTKPKKKKTKKGDDSN